MDHLSGYDFKTILGISVGLDVAFAFDTSQSVSKEVLVMMKKFAKAAVTSHSVSADDSRIGVISYGKSAVTDLTLSDGIISSAVSDAIETLTVVGGPRLMSKAIKEAIDNVFVTKSGGRIGSKKLFVIFTTGVAEGTDKTDLSEALEKLHKEKVNVVVVAVGSGMVAADFVSITKDVLKVIIIKPTMLPSMLGNFEEISSLAISKYLHLLLEIEDKYLVLRHYNQYRYDWNECTQRSKIVKENAL